MINTEYILPVLVLIIVGVALLRRVNAYHSFTTGVKDGMQLFLDIYPALLAMMCAIALLRQSGLMDILCSGLARHIAHIPKEIWPMVIFRPISSRCAAWIPWREIWRASFRGLRIQRCMLSRCIFPVSEFGK